MVKLSILLPTYNGARYLDEQLRSIFAQTDPDFEILAIDDGSSDGTVEILSGLARTDRRVSICPASGNRGQESRLWELFERSTGRFVAIADQDDIWAADRNEVLFGAMGDDRVVLGRSELIDRDGARLGKTLLQALKVAYTPDARLRALLQPMFSAHAMIVPRSRIHGGLFNRLVPFDWALALEAVFSGGIGYVPEATVFHRIHGGNQVNTVDVDDGPRRVTPAHLRYAFLFQRQERLKLWLNLDFLGRSGLVEREVARIFAAAARTLYNEWFTEWRSLNVFRQSKVVRELEPLRALAGSRDDAQFFFARLSALSCSPIGLPALREGVRRIKAG